MKTLLRVVDIEIAPAAAGAPARASFTLADVDGHIRHTVMSTSNPNIIASLEAGAIVEIEIKRP